MELLIFGHEGTPVIVFPTSQGRFYDYEDRGMVGALQSVLDGGRAQLFCVDSVDGESWYNYAALPRQRVVRHMEYEGYIIREVLPFIESNNDAGRLAVTGCSFGGYHAVNFSLRHPDRVDACISLGGAFDIKQFIAGYYDSDCYFNSPADFLPNLTDGWYLDLYETKLRIILATGEHDVCLAENLHLSHLLNEKGIRHCLDVWGDRTGHDWPWWQRMIAKFIK